MSQLSSYDTGTHEQFNLQCTYTVITYYCVLAYTRTIGLALFSCLLPPFQTLIRLTLLTLSLITRLIQKIVQIKHSQIQVVFEELLLIIKQINHNKRSDILHKF